MTTPPARPPMPRQPMSLPPKLRAALKMNEDGLIPAIARDASNKDILMMAWMNEDALAETLSSGFLCYWSRSRAKLWRKGESSGQRQKLVALRVDCDGDTLLIDVEQEGVACHTGRKSCFFRLFVPESGELKETSPVLVPPEELYAKKES